MVTKEVFILLTLALLSSGSETDEDEGLGDGSCNPSFEPTMVAKFYEAVQNCQYKPLMKMKITKFDDEYLLKKIRTSKIQTKLDLGPKIESAEDCHLICLTVTKCKAFRYRETECELMKKEMDLTNKYEADVDWVYGSKDDCKEGLEEEAKEYFDKTDLGLIAAKASYLGAKSAYDINNFATREIYSYTATACLSSLIQKGFINEEELGVSVAVTVGDPIASVPYLPKAGLGIETVSKAFSFRVDDGKVKKWVFTGLYAPAGKIVKATIPQMAVSKLTITIGANVGLIYGKGNQKENKAQRDPQVRMDFRITEESQPIGSPWGGLIIVELDTNSEFTGKIMDIRFDNVIETPVFDLSIDTNEDWNNRIKNLPGPWVIFRIPHQLTFVLPTKFVSSLTDVTTNLKEWKSFMTKVDFAACKTRNRGEVVVADCNCGRPSSSGYPVKTSNRDMLMGEYVFPPRGSINDKRSSALIGHEIGHNLGKLEAVSHYAINYYWNYAEPETRKAEKNGYWGRESRLFSYIRAGKEFLSELVQGRQTIMNDVIKLLMDGPDGSGWGEEGNWEDLHDISCIANQLNKGKDGTGLDWFIRIVCEAKQMNMMEYFQFWVTAISATAEEVCSKFPMKPTKMISWISEIEKLAAESLGSCDESNGWYGHAGKCFHISQDELPLKKAQRRCKKMDAELATIDTKEDAILFNYARGQLGEKGKRKTFYIGSISNEDQTFPWAAEFPTKSSVHEKKIGQALGVMQGLATTCFVGPKSKEITDRFEDEEEEEEEANDHNLSIGCLTPVEVGKGWSENLFVCQKVQERY